MTYQGDALAASAKKPGPALWLSIVTIVVGTIVGITGLAVGISKAINEFDGPIYTVPHTVQQQLSGGTFDVYAGVVGDHNTTTLNGSGISGITVTGPGGTAISTSRPTAQEFIERNGQQFYAFYTFKAPVSGDYSIQLRGAGGEPFFVSHSFGDLAKRAAGWLALMGAGILIGIAGVVMLIVGIVRRHRASRPAFVGGYAPGGFPPGGYPPGGGAPVAQATSTLPPAGWYPDPQIQGTSRYWDGSRWTDQTHTP